MISTKQKTMPSFTEFIIIISLMMSITGFSIDAMLPALGQISSDLVVNNPNDRQLVISVIFIGIAVGQLFFGPLVITSYSIHYTKLYDGMAFEYPVYVFFDII